MRSNRADCSKWLMYCYRLCLRAYPKSFRAQYSVEMEQAFADQIARLRDTKSRFAVLQFSIGMLRDTSETLCRQHWHTSHQTGFTRLRFLILLALFAPLVFFHKALVSKAAEGIHFVKNIKEIRSNAWHEEYEANRLRVSLNLRNSPDPIAVAAANLLDPNNSASNFPSGEALRQMNLSIAHEVIANPLHNSWFSKIEGISDTPTANMHSLLWSIENIEEFKRCNYIGKENGYDVTCNSMWQWMLEHRKYEELMITEGYQQPSQAQILQALENNQYAELKRQYIVLNGLDTACTFSDSRRFYNNINCAK